MRVASGVATRLVSTSDCEEQCGHNRSFTDIAGIANHPGTLPTESPAIRLQSSFFSNDAFVLARFFDEAGDGTMTSMPWHPPGPSDRNRF
ncbi:hypothetical protein CI15_32235 [Paraburkholderia monticola]|uniref:Uncharacterized protein n=1 Tax=Paraburkholderia monticola TaxID=1399968 RepID=A0A149PB34_9BURK|nr:hypothetical protein CI15_32235 [Paraburkholderia monticola]